jgi:hypothetical protein
MLMGELSFVFIFDALALDINPTLKGTSKPLDQARILPGLTTISDTFNTNRNMDARQR